MGRTRRTKVQDPDKRRREKEVRRGQMSLAGFVGEEQEIDLFAKVCLKIQPRRECSTQKETFRFPGSAVLLLAMASF